MDTDDDEPYVLRQADDHWVSPVPVSRAVTDALADATALSTDDVDDLDSYVDPAALRTVLDGEGESVTFAVEGHQVTVHGDGAVTVG
jgi:hypothetical protein